MIMDNKKSYYKMIFFCIILITLLITLEVDAISLPPDPDNAALLYYQAFLLLPDYDSVLIDPVLRGANPDENVRDYFETSREAIKLTMNATEIPQCNWGIIYSQGAPNLTSILLQLRNLVSLLELDARILAVDGDSRTALERCLSLHNVAQHISVEAIQGYLSSLALNKRVFLCIQHVLCTTSLDVYALKWLQGQLATFVDPSISLFRALEMDFEILLQSIRQDQDILELLREQLLENAVDENTKNEFLKLTDDEMISLAREPYTSFSNAIFKTIGSNMSYIDKYIEIQRLTNEFKEEYDSDPIISYVMFWSGVNSGQISDLHNLLVRSVSDLNAIKAATEIYLVKAETGQLPETLPAHLLKDPYSNQDFEYETTNQGFILRCKQKEIGKDELMEYEFVVVQ